MRTPIQPGDTIDVKAAQPYILRELIALLSVGALLFGFAGTFHWWGAWAMLAVTAGWSAGMVLVMLRRAPGLFAERMGLHKGAKRWDLVFMNLHSLLQMATFIVAGLDRRHGWTAGLPSIVQGVGMGMVPLGYALFLWAIGSNPFFSQIVRIQTERGHHVVAGGPYRFVRHPGYVGGVLTQLGVPLLLGSWPALALGAADTLFLFIRTWREDRTLQAELPGYAEYARQVRYRLVPGLW